MRARLTSLLVLAALLFGFVSPVQAADIRFVDVAEITWAGASAASATVSDVGRAIESDVARDWATFTTLQGDTRDRAIRFTLGRTLATPIRMAARMDCNRSDFTGYMNTIRTETYRQLGLSDWQERYLVILAPQAGCIWSGRATVGKKDSKGGVMMLHNNASAFVITHELGHTLGLGHTNLLRCDTGASDGAWSRDCRAVEYGGSIDVMGNVETQSPLSTYHQWRMGLLDQGEIKQSWVNESIELSASDVFGGTRAIFIRDGSSAYWIEYRRRSAAHNAGLVIYRTDPPSPSFIVSPNPDDRFAPEPGPGVGTDIWMLNFDNYSYSFAGRSSGSMTLVVNKPASFHSGNVTLQAISGSDERKVTVRVTRRADTVAPPVPQITPIERWRFPGVSIIPDTYDDGESAIASFEARIDSSVVTLNGVVNDSFAPTYLDPLVTRRTVYVKDLPEGTYDFSLRAIDVWGNRSDWSTPRKVTIDRGLPVVDSSISITDVTSESFRVALSDLRDAGSGLCSTQIMNEDGFILQASSAKSAPEFRIKRSGSLQARLDVFDCLGNGITSRLSVKSDFVPATKAARTGKWSPATALGDGAISCSGRCSASFSTSGKTQLLVADGSATVSVASREVARVAAASAKRIRVGASFDVGARNRIVRVTGTNLTLVGLAKIDLGITEKKEIARRPSVTDPSLSDATQKLMARYGFVAEDFADDWIVLPMARGTTLEDPTLDLCSSDFKSESGRQFRRQLSISKVGTPYLFLSSEVVKYRNQAAASAALAELKTVYEECVRKGGGTERDGAFLKYAFTPLPSSDIQLVAESSRLLVRAQLGEGVTARWLLAFYQFKDEMFTGLYVVRDGATGFSDQEVLRWYEAASILAKRLDTKY